MVLFILHRLERCRSTPWAAYVKPPLKKKKELEKLKKGNISINMAMPTEAPLTLLMDISHALLGQLKQILRKYTQIKYTDRG